MEFRQNDDGPYVTFVDAEAQIRAAETRGYDKGRVDSWHSTREAEELVRAALQREREECAALLFEYAKTWGDSKQSYAVMECATRIRSRGEKEAGPKKPEPIWRLKSYDDREVADKVDELVDRVNELWERAK